MEVGEVAKATIGAGIAVASTATLAAAFQTSVSAARALVAATATGYTRTGPTQNRRGPTEDYGPQTLEDCTTEEARPTRNE